MTDFEKTLLDVLQSETIDIVIFVIIGMVVMFRNAILEWISSRVRAKNQNYYDQQLETHRAKLSQENSLHLLQTQNQLEQIRFLNESVRLSFSEGQKSSMERKLQAIDQIWSEVMKIRNTIPPLMTIVDAMKANENHRNSEILNHELIKNTNWSENEFKDKIKSISNSVAECRPYVGEFIWAIFSVYQAIHLRVCIGLKMGEISVDDVVKWYEDEVIQQIISAVLDKGDLKTFNNMEYGKFAWLQRNLEQKLLTQLNRIISGELYGDEIQQKFAATALETLSKISIESAHDQPKYPH